MGYFYSVSAGLEVPLLTQKSDEQLATFFNLVGASCRNPIDPGTNWGELKFIMKIVEQDPNIDNMVVVLVWSAIRMLTHEQLENHINLVANIRKATVVSLPLTMLSGRPER